MKIRIIEYEKLNGNSLEKMREILLDFHSSAKLKELQSEMNSKLNIIIEKQQIFYNGIDLTQKSENIESPLFSLLCDKQCQSVNDENHIHSLRVVVRDRILYRSISSDSHSLPSVENLIPNTGSIHGGNNVVIKAMNINHSQHWIVSFGTIFVPGEKISDFEIQCVAPAHSAGSVAVEISHDGSYWTSNQQIYTFTDFTPNSHGVLVPASIAPSSIPISAPCKPMVEIKQPPRADQ